MPQSDRGQEARLGVASPLSAPQALSEAGPVVLSGFDCGEPSLNKWLARRARKSDGLSSRTYVVVNSGNVAAYYCLSAGSVDRRPFPSRIKRNMPDPIPVIVLGRLAVDKRFQNRGLGTDILRHSLIQAISASDIIGFRAMLIHSLNEKVRDYYEGLGFSRLSEPDLTVYMPIETIRAAFAT